MRRREGLKQKETGSEWWRQCPLSPPPPPPDHSPSRPGLSLRPGAPKQAVITARRARHAPGARPGAPTHTYGRVRRPSPYLWSGPAPLPIPMVGSGAPPHTYGRVRRPSPYLWSGPAPLLIPMVGPGAPTHTYGRVRRPYSYLWSGAPTIPRDLILGRRCT